MYLLKYKPFPCRSDVLRCSDLHLWLPGFVLHGSGQLSHVQQYEVVRPQRRHERRTRSLQDNQVRSPHLFISLLVELGNINVGFSGLVLSSLFTDLPTAVRFKYSHTPLVISVLSLEQDNLQWVMLWSNHDRILETLV